MSSSDLISLINRLKEEINNYYSLIKKNSHEKIPQIKEIRKQEIKDSRTAISLINQHIQLNIDNFKKIIEIKKKISNEKEIKNKLEQKSKKINDFIEKGKKILINNIPYFQKLPDYANKKLKTAKLSPLDLINLTLRLGQQSKAPPGGFEYMKNMIDSAFIEDQQNNFNLYSFYIKNKNRYLYPYPEMLELKNSILRYDFSEENRLLPPILTYPDPKKVDKDGNIIANKGSQIKLKYPSDQPIRSVFFKYSKEVNIIPSFFSGEEYKEYSFPDLDKDCIFKVCSCKKGFKDSKIITFKFVVNNEIEERLTKKEAKKEAKIDQIIRETNKIDNTDLHFSPFQSFACDSQVEVNQGTSSYRPTHINPEDLNEDDDEDSI